MANQDIQRLRQLEDEIAQREELLRKAQERNDSNTVQILQQQINQRKTLMQQSQTYQGLQTKINKELDKAQISFAKMDYATRKILQNSNGINGAGSIFAQATENIAKRKAQESELTGQQLETFKVTSQVLENINKSFTSQAQSTAKALQDAQGLSQFDIARNELASRRGDLTQKEYEQTLAQISATEKLYQQEERLKEIKKQQQGILGMMPDGIKQMVGFAKDFGTAIKAGLGPLFIVGAVIAAAVKSFMDLENAAADFRKETGLLNSQMEDVRSQANQITQEFAEIGVESKDVFDTVSKLKGEFGDTVNFSKETVAALTVMNKNFGIAAESSAKVQSIFESVGGLSGETAANVQLQVANMAKLAGVSPDKVFKDIAENAEAASTFFKGDLTALTKNAVQARRMGTSLKEQVSLAEKLLDFENGIEQELVAATFVGGQFNLSRARALAMEGKLAEANEETLKQIQRSGDFKKKDYFTQQQLAKAAGMSVEEINKQLDAQEKLNSLSGEQKKAAEDAINAGLDITNISKENLASETEKFKQQQEQQKTLDKISNQFMGIASTIGSVLVPVLDAVALLLNVILSPIMLINDMFGWIGEKISALTGPLGTVGKILKGLAGIAIVWAAYAAFQSIAGFMPIVGPILGGIAAAAVLAAGFGALSKVGDMYSPADGKTQVSTKEGGLFELSPNDDLVAAPGAAAALADGKGGAGGAAVNLAALSAPLNALLGEIKALRADMNSGKIAVHMDGAKVTSGIAKQVEKNSRNNFAMSQA